MSKVPPYTRRYLQSLISPRKRASRTFAVAGRVWMCWFDIPYKVQVDRICYQVGAVQAGNVRLGIYRDVNQIPDGGVLVIESASVAQGAVDAFQQVTIANTWIEPGEYWLAIQGDNVAGTFWNTIDSTGIINRRYDRGGGYGAFTDPCPATGAGGRASWGLLRIIL